METPMQEHFSSLLQLFKKLPLLHQRQASASDRLQLVLSFLRYQLLLPLLGYQLLLTYLNLELGRNRD